MKKKYRVFILCAILSVCIYPQNKREYLEAAEKAAAWLNSLEKTSGSSGICWPASSTQAVYRLGIDAGAAGIGMFFLKLYQVTGNQNYFQKAEKAAEYIQAQYSQWYGPDWLNGVAGYGHYYILLYKQTGNNKYLDYAKSAAQWLIQKASNGSNGIVYWVNPINPPVLYTGYAHGTSGIGFFLLELYEITNDNNLLNYSERGFKWLTQHYIRLNNNAIGWKRLITDTVIYNHWCGGSVGIMFFLEKLYTSTGKNEYLQYYKETANGLVFNSEYISNSSLTWGYGNTGSFSYPVVYCHGTSSASHILFMAGQLLNDSNYKNTAIKGMNWIKDIKQVNQQGNYYWSHAYNWAQYDTGYMTGTAGIGISFLEAFKYNPNQEYLNYAESAARFLLNVGENVGNDKIKWINYINAENLSYDPKLYQTGWYSGAAGIGLFLLQLYEVYNPVVSITVNDTEIPRDYFLRQNYPNPFNPTTKIKYTIPSVETERASSLHQVILRVYDSLGREIRTLVNEIKPAGNYEIEFSSKGLPAGVYYYVLRANNYSQTKKMVLLK